jgi:hypothetical protein
MYVSLYICPVLILLYICSVERVPKEGAADVCGSCCTGLEVASDIFSFFFSFFFLQSRAARVPKEGAAEVCGSGWCGLEVAAELCRSSADRGAKVYNPKP